MKKYLALYLTMITGLLGACTGDGGFGPQGPGRWGNLMHSGFGSGGMYLWIILVLVIAVFFYFYVPSLKTKGRISRRNESPIDALKRHFEKSDIPKGESKKTKQGVNDIAP